MGLYDQEAYKRNVFGLHINGLISGVSNRNRFLVYIFSRACPVTISNTVTTLVKTSWDTYEN